MANPNDDLAKLHITRLEATARNLASLRADPGLSGYRAAGSGGTKPFMPSEAVLWIAAAMLEQAAAFRRHHGQHKWSITITKPGNLA